MPDAARLDAAIADIVDILAGTLRDTGLESDLDELLWSLTDLFHKKAPRIERQLDENEDRQKRSQRATRFRLRPHITRWRRKPAHL